MAEETGITGAEDTTQSGVDTSTTETGAEKGTGQEELVALNDQHEAVDQENANVVSLADHQALLEQVATLQANQERTAVRDAYNQKIAGIDPNHASLKALNDREDFDLDTIELADMNMIVDSVVAGINAQGAAKVEAEKGRVTVDGADKRHALMDSLVMAKPIKLGDQNYKADDILKLANDFGETELANNKNEMWKQLQNAAVEIGTMMQGNDDSLHGLTIETTGASFGSTVLQTIVRAGPVLYNESKFVQDYNRLVPAMARYSVPDISSNYHEAVQSDYAEPAKVGEGETIPDADSPAGWRFPLKPDRYDFNENITWESFTASPTTVVRRIPRKMADANARNIYKAVMNILFGQKAFTPAQGGQKAGAGNFTAATVNESETLDATVPLYSGAANNAVTNWVELKVSAAGDSVSTLVTYDFILRLMNIMNAFESYGAANFTLAGIAEPSILVVPPGAYLSARGIVESQAKPGSSTIEANLTRGLTVIPANRLDRKAGFGDGADTRADMVLVANPNTIQALYASYYNGMQSPTMVPDPSRETVFTKKTIRFQNNFIFRVGAIDRRAFVSGSVRKSGEVV